MAKHDKVYKDGVIPFKNMQEAEQLRKETEDRLRQNPMLMNAFVCPNNEIFITAIDWGKRFVATTINSFRLYNFYQFSYNYNKGINGYRRTLNHIFNEIEQVQNLDPAATRFQRDLIKKYNILYNDTEMAIARLYNDMDREASIYAKQIVATCPYNSVIAIEWQDKFNDAGYQQNYNGVNFVVSNGASLVYKHLLDEAPKRKIMIIPIGKDRSSITCPICGRMNPSNRHKERHLFECDNCGFTVNDDVNAAYNIMIRAYDMLKGQKLINQLDDQSNMVSMLGYSKLNKNNH